MRSSGWDQNVMDLGYIVTSAPGCHQHWPPWDKYTRDALCTKTISDCSFMRHLEKLAGGRQGLALPQLDFCFHNSGVSRSEKNKTATSPEDGLDGGENHANNSTWSQRRGPQWKCAVGCSPA